MTNAFDQGSKRRGDNGQCMSGHEVGASLDLFGLHVYEQSIHSTLVRSVAHVTAQVKYCWKRETIHSRQEKCRQMPSNPVRSSWPVATPAESLAGWNSAIVRAVHISVTCRAHGSEVM